MFNKLINTNSGGGTAEPFTSSSYVGNANIGVSTTSFWGHYDFTYNPNDGYIYSVSRSGVGYWLLARNTYNPNTTTTIVSGTPGAAFYGFLGIYNKDNTLYINEDPSDSYVNWSTSGSRGSTLFSYSPQTSPNGSAFAAYNSTADEAIITENDGSGNVTKLLYYNASTGSFLREIDISSIVGLGYGIEWANVGGDGVLFVMDYNTYKCYQFLYDGTYTGFFIDYSSYSQVQNQNRSCVFLPDTNELIISTMNSQSGTASNRNLCRVFQLS